MGTYQTALEELAQQLPAALENAYESARRRRQKEFVQAVAEQLFLLDEKPTELSPWEEVAARVRWQQAVLRCLVKK